jgi:hypothetical protein
MQIDKNIKDLINVCHTFEIHPPTREQMTHIVKDIFPEITTNPTDCNDLVDYIGEDLSKLCLTHEYYGDNPLQLLEDIKTIFIKKSQNTDRTQKIHQLYTRDIPLRYHSHFINETDRTTVSLLWHENVVDILKSFHIGSMMSVQHSMPSQESVDMPPPKKTKKSSSSTATKRKPSKASITKTTAPPISTTTITPTESISISTSNQSLQKTLPIYVRILDNICYSDYIDRTTFQKQVWKLNEISSIIKTFKNNHLLHLELLSTKDMDMLEPILPTEIRFTKILTKYSSEYNNFWFIRNICQTLGFDKNDLLEQSIKYSRNSKESGLLDLFEANEFDMTTLSRLIKYYKVCSTGVLNTALEVSGGDVVIHELERIELIE